MARLALRANDPTQTLPEPPPLYRSEGFAEDLPGWDDAPAAPSEALVHGLAGWLMGAPLALALVGVVSSVAVWA